MQKNKFFLFVAMIALVICGGAGIFVFAQTQEAVGRTLPDTIYEREDAETTKTIKVITSETSSKDANRSKSTTNWQDVANSSAIHLTESNKILKYYRTDAYDSDKPIDIYTDASNGQYRYDRSGRLLNYINLDYNLLIEPEQPITKDQATKLAYAQLKAAYGASIDAMTLVSCETPDGGSFPGQYEIKYEKRAGNGDFIYVYGVTIYISLDGEVLGFSLASSAEREALNLTVIKDITKTTLDAWVLNQIDADSSSPFDMCETEELTISYDIYIDDEQPYIRAYVFCNNSFHSHLFQKYFYEIS